MSFPRYAKYIDSGQTWLGDIPSHWRAPPLYLRYTAELGKMLDSSRIVGVSLLPYLRNVDVQWGEINFVELPQMDIEPHEIARYTVRPGDLLVCEGGEVGRAAVVAEIPYPIAFQKALHRLRALHPRELPQYLFYVFRWAAEAGVFAVNGQSTIAHLTGEQLRRYRFPCPPFDDQAAIAIFLDRETTKIDALISEQEKLIALLAEKRQATIFRAITQGIRFRSPMRDSGIHWMGMIPTHWDVAPLKYILELRSGSTPSKENPNYWNGDVPWASAKDIKLETLSTTTDHITRYAIDSGAATLIPAGAVLIVVRGMILARMFPVALTTMPAAINQDLKAILPGRPLDRRFLAWLLRGSAAESLLRLDEAGHGTKALRMDAWTSMSLPIPPLSEQTEIATFLEEQTSRIDKLSTQAELVIARLKERRNALIASAVTGQIDVRGAVPQTDAQEEFAA